MKIGPGIHLISTKIGQSILMEGPPLTIIDCGAPGSIPRIESTLGKVGRKLEDIEQIVLTHAHNDHIGTAAAIKKRSGAKVLIHAADEAVANGSKPSYPFIKKGVLANLLSPLEKQITKLGSAYEPVEIDGFIHDGMTLDPGIKIIETPGHTPGHVSVLLPEAGVLHAADAIFNWTGMRPPLQMSTQNLAVADLSIVRLADLDFKRLTFGHGTPVFKGARRRLDRLSRRLAH